MKPLGREVIPLVLGVALSGPGNHVEGDQGRHLSDPGASGRAAAVRVFYRASLPRRQFHAGEPIKLSLHFTNLSDQPVTIWQSGFWPNHRVLLTDEEGREPPLTNEGRERLAAFSPEGERSKNVPRVLQAGRSMVEMRSLDLTELYEVKKGRYRVRVTYHDLQGPTPLRLISNTLAFEVD
jgi:hypothetical protein